MNSEDLKVKFVLFLLRNLEMKVKRFKDKVCQSL